MLVLSEIYIRIETKKMYNFYQRFTINCKYIFSAHNVLSDEFYLRTLTYMKQKISNVNFLIPLFIKWGDNRLNNLLTLSRSSLRCCYKVNNYNTSTVL